VYYPEHYHYPAMYYLVYLAYHPAIHYLADLDVLAAK
jgi:hypothetical protein